MKGTLGNIHTTFCSILGEDNQIQLRRIAKSKLNMVKNRDHESVTVLADEISEEMKTVLESYKNHKIIEEPYQISLNLNLLDKNDRTNQLISYVISIGELNL